MRSTVKLVTTLVIHASIPVPAHCGVCAMWNIERRATYFGQWEDACGPDNYIGVCINCQSNGFVYIGTIGEFKQCQLRASGKPEYEVYGNDNARTSYMCSSRADAMGHIRSMIGHGISVDTIYQRDANTGRLRKLDGYDQARIVIEAMEA